MSERARMKMEMIQRLYDDDDDNGCKPHTVSSSNSSS